MLAVPVHALRPAPLTREAIAYKDAYRAVARRYGRRTPGRYLLAHHHTARQLRASLRILDRMLHPVAVRVPVATTVPTAAAVAPTILAPAPTSPAPSVGLPTCTWQPESGGNWTAVNPTSGAYGRYQILASTAQAYGCNLSTDAGQTACAETVYQHQGAGAWVGCGG